MIQDYCFRNCRSVTALGIPAAVTEICRGAFYGCSGLSYVLFRCTCIKNIGQEAFMGIGSNTVLYMQGCNPPAEKIGTNALGISCVVVADINSTIHKYTKTHTGCKFLSTDACEYIRRCYAWFTNTKATRGNLPALSNGNVLADVRKMAYGQLTGTQMIKKTVESTTCKNRKWTNEEYVTGFYRAMLNRGCSAAENNSWKKYLDVGMSLNKIIRGFIDAKECKTKWAKWLITRGSLALTLWRDQNYNITKFVYDAYVNCLARKAKTNELDAGCQLLIGQKKTAYYFLHSLFKSAEYTKRNRNTTNFVKDLYKTYLRRTGSSSEWNTWIKKINVDKKSRDYVENGFASSTEFKNKMKDIGLVAK